MYLRLQTWLFWGVYVRFQGCNRHSISFSTSTYKRWPFITVITWNCRNDWVTTREQTSAGDLLKIWILEERPWKGIRVNHRLQKSTLNKGIHNPVYQIPPKNTPRHFTTKKHLSPKFLYQLLKTKCNKSHGTYCTNIQGKSSFPWKNKTSYKILSDSQLNQVGVFFSKIYLPTSKTSSEKLPSMEVIRSLFKQQKRQSTNCLDSSDFVEIRNLLEPGTRWFKSWPFYPQVAVVGHLIFERVTFSPSQNGSNVELAIKNQGAIIIFQVHHHDFRGKQILITFSKALIKFAIDMLYYYFFWPKTPSRNNKLLKNQVAIKKFFFWARKFF